MSSTTMKTMFGGREGARAARGPEQLAAESETAADAAMTSFNRSVTGAILAQNRRPGRLPLIDT